VAFLQEGSNADRGVRDADAYALLLEIVCGLRSPIVGETEVQAQFKAFLASLSGHQYASLLRLGQHVLADAKRIRQRHLQGFGAHSYGALAAQHISCGRLVAIIGTGALAGKLREALPPDLHVDQWGRRPETLPEDGRLISSAAASSRRETPTSFVIAAPAATSDLMDVAACYADVREVIDLRAADERLPLPFGHLTITLDDLFAAAAARSLPAAAIDAARDEVRKCARAFAERTDLRPFGWDDLCA
jgi:glutamyl-tRNA reductase